MKIFKRNFKRKIQMMIDRGCYVEQATFTYLLPEKLPPETN